MTPERKKPRIHVRFTAADGAEWTVWDVTWSNKKHHRRPHGDPTATERVFVNAKDVKRAYKFKASDFRVLEEQSLDRQLRESAFLPTTKEDKDPERRCPALCVAQRKAWRAQGPAA